MHVSVSGLNRGTSLMEANNYIWVSGASVRKMTIDVPARRSHFHPDFQNSQNPEIRKSQNLDSRISRKTEKTTYNAMACLVMYLLSVFALPPALSTEDFSAQPITISCWSPGFVYVLVL